MLHDMILPCLLSVSKIDWKRFSLILSLCSWNKIKDQIDRLITDHSNYIFRSYWLKKVINSVHCTHRDMSRGEAETDQLRARLESQLDRWGSVCLVMGILRI